MSEYNPSPYDQDDLFYPWVGSDEDLDIYGGWCDDLVDAWDDERRSDDQ